MKYMTMIDFDRLAVIIKTFVTQYLDGDIERLCEFPLSRLREDKVFGCRGRNFDPDDTEIMRHIYVVLFSEVWPDLSMEALKDGVFRGDTLNTYNTLFQAPSEESVHPGLDRFNPSAELSRAVADFSERFTCIGNMVPLPNLRVDGKSMNTYRGTHGLWHDFFDRFLIALHAILTEAVGRDAKLAALIEANAKFFAPYQGEDGFRKLVDGLMLNDYVDAHYQPILSSKSYFFWMRKVSAEDYTAEAMRYVNFATAIINHRSRLMVDRLKAIL